MKHARLDDMVKGWFVGDFDPTLLRSKDVEVAVKYCKAGQDLFLPMEHAPAFET